jgi:hypothetical protein
LGPSRQLEVAEVAGPGWRPGRTRRGAAPGEGGPVPGGI